MARPEKEAVVKEIVQSLTEGDGIVFVNYRGLSVKDMTELRTKLREENANMTVVKNTLVALAAEQVGIEGADEFLVGPTALAFSTDDPTVAPRILSEFAKNHETLEVKGGVLEGKIIDAEEVKALGNLPSREVLLGQVLRGMLSPVSGLANVLAGPVRNLAYVLEAIRAQKEGAA